MKIMQLSLAVLAVVLSTSTAWAHGDEVVGVAFENPLPEPMYYTKNGSNCSVYDSESTCDGSTDECEINERVIAVTNCAVVDQTFNCALNIYADSTKTAYIGQIKRSSGGNGEVNVNSDCVMPDGESCPYTLVNDGQKQTTQDGCAVNITEAYVTRK